MQQQTGIAALPQQQPPQMPGQAPGIQQAVPQMQPKGNAASGISPKFYEPLSQMDIPALVRELNNPQVSQFPALSVLAEITHKQKAQKLNQEIQGQAAMQQAQQQRGSVKDEILAQVQQPVMAAQGGMMQGYANGGAVAFEEGGGVSSPAKRWFSDLASKFSLDIEEQNLRQKIKNELAMKSSPAGVFMSQSDQERERAKEIMRLLPSMSKEQMQNILGETQRTGETAAWQGGGPGESGDFATPQSQPIVDVSEKQTQPVDTGLKKILKASVGAGSMGSSASASKPEDYDRLRRAAAEQQSAIYQASMVPEELQAQLKGIQSLRSGALTEEQKATKEFMEAAMKRRDEQVGAAKRSLFENPEALFRLAGSIDPRRGRGISSLASGLGTEMQGQRKAVSEAEEKYAASQNEARRMQSLNRALEIANAEKNYAEANGLSERANAAKKDIARISSELEKTVLDFQDKSKGRDIESLKAQAAFSNAAAVRTSNEQARLGQLLRSIEQNKQAAVEKVTEAIDKKYELPLKMIRIKQMQNAPLSEAEQAQAQAYKAELNAARSNASRFFDAQRGKVEETLYGGPITPQGRDEGAKTMTMDDVQTTASKSGKTPEEVKRAAIAAGYTIK